MIEHVTLRTYEQRNEGKLRAAASKGINILLPHFPQQEWTGDSAAEGVLKGKGRK
jgi:hypothetical protein